MRSFLRKGVRAASLRQDRHLDEMVEAPKVEAAAEVQPQVGYIDKLGAGRVTGWAASRDDLDASVSVCLYLDDRLVAEGEAALQRNDVRDAGYGNGRHGFDLPVPKKALMVAKTLKLTVRGPDGDESTCDRQVLRPQGSRAAPALFMDASDLIEFLTHHREMSGIQRVQAGYLTGLGDARIAGTQCLICTRFKSSSFYFDVPYVSFCQLLQDAGDVTRVSKFAWAEHVQKYKESLTTRIVLAPGDTIFTMGAPWALDDHNETIRCAKLHDGAHYLQVFYDLIPISVPEVVAAPLIPHFARAMAAMSVYSDHVFAISRYSQDDLAGTLKKINRSVPPTSVVPMGGTIDDAERGIEPTADTLGALGIDGPFVLCVGTLEPRKNHTLLFQVWRRLVAKHGVDKVPKLILVGRIGWYMEDFMRQLKITGYVEKTIVHLQGISNAELAALYDACLYTIFPSFSEGWGLPITESLARGKICVCSDVTSMPEAGGNHALYIDPYDTTAAFDVCERLIFDSAYKTEQEIRARGFVPQSWADASEGLREQFDKLVPRLAARPQRQTRRPVELGRTYKFFNIEAASPEATSTEVFRNFLDQEDALDLLAGWNWFELDVNCTWACGPEAELSLVLPEGSKAGFIVYLGLVIPPCYENVPCDVLVDDILIGRFKAAGAWNVSLEVSGSAPRQVEVTLRFTRARLPSADGRLLGIGIATVAVFALDDYKGRMEHFEARAVEALSEMGQSSIQGQPFYTYA